MKNAVEARPGQNVHIVLTVDTGKEATDVRSSIIYDILGTEFILSQTNPPMTASRHTGKSVSVTYLVGERGEAARYGFEGNVVDVVKEYNLSSSNTAPAIRIRRRTEFRQYDLRMHYRLKLRLNEPSLSLHLRNEKVSLIDISLGGARFCFKSDHPVESGEIDRVVLSIDGHRFPIDVRGWPSRSPVGIGAQSDMRYVEVQFLNMNKQCNSLLNMKILSIQREILSKHSVLQGG